ncbi:MAG: DNA polymerase IV [Phycisphaerae bacterium]|nr:DNA polymerase IV [Phycisphaerae bacterium]
MTDRRHILHIDMDAFFASVEQLDNPQLRGKTVMVGGSSKQRGVVAACSYEARKFGVHSAMPMIQATRLCPHGTVMPVRMARYVEISRKIHHIFHNFTPFVEPLSIDEAFLDVTGCIKLMGSAETIGQNIKKEIKEKIGLTASVGLAPNKFLAKLASDLDKPDGFVIITDQNKQQILDALPISRIWGIGKVTAEKLNKIGIKTIAQLRNTSPDYLRKILNNQTETILNLAQGIDNRNVETATEAKSISAEQTFAKDIDTKETLLEILQGQVEEVSARLRAEFFQTRTITLKMRYSDFRTITKSQTLQQPTNTTHVLLQEAQDIFNNWHKHTAGPLRLLGFGAANLIEQGKGQQMLFSDPEEEKFKKVDSAMDEIRKKFGNDALKRGKW